MSLPDLVTSEYDAGSSEDARVDAEPVSNPFEFASDMELGPRHILCRRPVRRQPVVSLYSQMDTDGEIGGIHLGTVAKKVEVSSSGKINLMDYDTTHFFLGLCFYPPLHKQNQKVDCRDQAKMKHFLEIPYILTRLFQYSEYHNHEYYSSMLDRLKKYLPEMIGLQEQQKAALNSSGLYRVRFEFFCGSKNLGDDIELPVLPLDKLLYKANHVQLKYYLYDRMDSVKHPLRNFYRDIENLTRVGCNVLEWMSRDLKPDEKTTLLYAAEQLISLLELAWGHKRGMAKYFEDWINTNMPETKQYRIFSSGIPSDLTVEVTDPNATDYCLFNACIERYLEEEGVREEVDESLNSPSRRQLDGQLPPNLPLAEVTGEAAEEEDTTSYHLIKSVAFFVEPTELNSRIVEKDFKRLPKNFPTIAGEIHKEVQLPKMRILYEQWIRQIMFKIGLTPRERRQMQYTKNPVFWGRDYRLGRVNLISEEETEEIISELASVCLKAYFCSILFLFRCRVGSLMNLKSPIFTDADLSIENFPRTANDFDPWLENQREKVADGKKLQKLIRCKLGQRWKDRVIDINSPKQLVDMCFLNPNSKRQKRLNNLLCNHVYDEVTAQMRRILAYLNDPQNGANRKLASIWNVANLNSKLLSDMHRYVRRRPGDDSPFIVWNLSDLRYERIRPLIVGTAAVPNVNRGDIAEGNSTPYAYHRIAPSVSPNMDCVNDVRTNINHEAYFSQIDLSMPPNNYTTLKRGGTRAEDDTPSKRRRGTRDQLFSYIKNHYSHIRNVPFLISDIIALRIEIGFEMKLQVQNVNDKKFSQHNKFRSDGKYPGLISMTQIFGGATNVLKDRINQVRRGYVEKNKIWIYQRIKELAERNYLHWDVNANNLIELFVHNDADENLMEAAIASGNIWKVIELAYEGIITESCLMALMKLQKVYWDFKSTAPLPTNGHEALFIRKITTEKFLN